MYNVDEIKKSWTNIDDLVVRNVCEHLYGYNYDLLNNLLYFVSALCNIQPVDILSVSDKIHVSQARWLLWYAYRYMTHESYERISDYMCIEGHRFNTRSVAAGIEKMAKLIEQETLWGKRWHIIKSIIKIWKNNKTTEIKKDVVITIPKDSDINIKVKQI